MIRRGKRIAAGAVALVAIAGGSGAYAASRDAQEESDAIVADAAEQLGVTPAALGDAIEQALANRIDAAVAAGELTEEQGAELKERIAAGEVPLLGLRPGLGHHRGGPGRLGGLEAAATYLGVTQAELRESLRDGETLADVARAEGKSAEGLVAALVREATERLDQAVEDGRLTQAQRDERAAELEERMTALVDGELRLRGHGPHGGPPPAWDGDAAA